MVCSMVKKGLIGAALGAGALFLVFGTHAPSYVKTAFHKVTQNAKDAVPLPFDIDRARDEIASLEPAIRDNIEKLARAEVDVEHLDKEIAAIRTNMDGEKKAMLTPAGEPQDGRVPPGRPQPRGLHRGRGQDRPGPPVRRVQQRQDRSSRPRSRPSRPSRARSSPSASSSRP